MSTRIVAIAALTIALVIAFAGTASAAKSQNLSAVLSGAEYGSVDTGYCSSPYRRSAAGEISCSASQFCTSPYRRSSTGAILPCDPASSGRCSNPYRRSSATSLYCSSTDTTWYTFTDGGGMV